MAFNNVPVNGWPQIKDLEKLDALAKQIEDMPVYTSDDRAFLDTWEHNLPILAQDVSDLNTTKANQITIAPTFSTETAYDVGDLVYYNGLTYRCTNAHEGEWDADDFAATTVSNELDTLKSGLTNITNLTESMTAINSTITRGYAYRRGNTVTVFVDITKNAFGWECVGGLPKPLTNGTQDLLISAIDLSDNSPIMGYVDNSGRLCCLNDTDNGQYRISGTYATMD